MTGWQDAPLLDETQGAALESQPAWMSAPVTEDGQGDGLRQETTAAGPRTSMAGALSGAVRGMAPLAAGAAAGALAGSAILPGAGTAVGAGAGVATVGILELGDALLNPVLSKFGVKLLSPREASDHLLDWMGVERPDTPVERFVGAVAGGAVGAWTTAQAAASLSEILADPVGRAIVGSMAAEPWMQAVSGGTGAAAGQLAAEAHLSPMMQLVATIGGGMAPYAIRGAASSLFSARGARPSADFAHDNGFVTTPSEAFEKPGAGTQIGEALSGKIQTGQLASEINQGRAQELIRQEFDLAEGTQLNGLAYNRAKIEADDAYRALADAMPVMKKTATFKGAVSQIGARLKGIAQDFGDATAYGKVSTMVDGMVEGNTFSAQAGLDYVRSLRSDAAQNFQAIGDPEKYALAIAQRQAADALDDCIQQNLATLNRQGLVETYKAARTTLAKIADAKSATNLVTGEVNGAALAKMLQDEVPLSGNLRVIAEVAANHPKAMQLPSSFAHARGWSYFDVSLMGASATGFLASGNPAALAPAAFFLARPYVRRMLLSQGFQAAIRSDALRAPALPLSGIAAATGSVTQPEAVQ